MKWDAHHVRYVVGTVGNVISFCLFASPAPTFWGILKKKSIEEFQPYPYLATVMNCLMWIFYGMPFVTPDSILVYTINGIGLALELIYLIIYYIYTPTKKRKVEVVGILVLILAVVAAFVAITLHFEHTKPARQRIVGIVCIVFGIIMYSSPLLVMKKVIKTKSVEFMPFFLSLASFTNGLVWTAYALLQFDLFILIANGAGAFVGLVQLVLYGCYFRTEESKVAKKGKIPKSTKDQDCN